MKVEILKYHVLIWNFAARHSSAGDPAPKLLNDISMLEGMSGSEVAFVLGMMATETSMPIAYQLISLAATAEGELGGSLAQALIESVFADKKHEVQLLTHSELYVKQPDQS